MTDRSQETTEQGDLTLKIGCGESSLHIAKSSVVARVLLAAGHLVKLVPVETESGRRMYSKTSPIDVFLSRPADRPDKALPKRKSAEDTETSDSANSTRTGGRSLLGQSKSLLPRKKPRVSEDTVDDLPSPCCGGCTLLPHAETISAEVSSHGLPPQPTADGCVTGDNGFPTGSRSGRSSPWSLIVGPGAVSSGKVPPATVEILRRLDLGSNIDNSSMNTLLQGLELPPEQAALTWLRQDSGPVGSWYRKQTAEPEDRLSALGLRLPTHAVTVQKATPRPNTFTGLCETELHLPRLSDSDVAGSSRERLNSARSRDDNDSMSRLPDLQQSHCASAQQCVMECLAEIKAVAATYGAGLKRVHITQIEVCHTAEAQPTRAVATAKALKLLAHIMGSTFFSAPPACISGSTLQDSSHCSPVALRMRYTVKPPVFAQQIQLRAGRPALRSILRQGPV